MTHPVRALAAAWLLLLAACAGPLASRPAVPPDPDAVRARLLQEQASTRTLRGLARLAFAGPQGSGSASQVVVVALPDRARLETLTPLGTTALVATLRDEELRVHSPLRHEYAVGRATRETLGRLVKVPVPPELFLRLLAGLPPLPLRAEDPRFAAVADGSSVRMESADGGYWQRLWIEAGEAGAARGEVGRAGDVLFRFSLGEAQPTDGRSFPFEVQVEDPVTQSQLRLHYERVQLNVPVDADLFDLPAPADPNTRIMELGGAAAPGSGSPRG